jgi:hypothetical protein
MIISRFCEEEERCKGLGMGGTMMGSQAFLAHKATCAIIRPLRLEPQLALGDGGGGDR